MSKLNDWNNLTAEVKALGQRIIKAENAKQETKDALIRKFQEANAARLALMVELKMIPADAI